MSFAKVKFLVFHIKYFFKEIVLAEVKNLVWVKKIHLSIHAGGGG